MKNSQTGISAKTQECIKKNKLIIGIESDLETVPIIRKTMIKTIEKCRTAGCFFNYFFILPNKDKNLYCEGDKIFLPETHDSQKEQKSKSSQSTLIWLFFNYCRIYFKEEWTHLIFVPKDSYLNLLWVFFGSNFQYYHRYGPYIWHASLIEYLCNKGTIDNWMEISIPNSFKLKEIEHGYWKDFWNPKLIAFYRDNENSLINQDKDSLIKVKGTEKIFFINITALMKGIGIKYKDHPRYSIETLFNFHFWLESTFESIEDFSLPYLTFYHLPVYIKKKHEFEVKSHLFWGVYFHLENKIEKISLRVFSGGMNENDLESINLLKDQSLFHPIYSGEILSISPSPESIFLTRVECLMFKKEALEEQSKEELSEEFKGCHPLFQGDEILLINFDHDGYFEYKNLKFTEKIAEKGGKIDLNNIPQSSRWIIKSIEIVE